MRLFNRRRPDEDFSEEVQTHLDLETERLVSEGMNVADARAAARRAFGSTAIVKERFHEAGRWVWLEHLGQDLKYAARNMRQAPAFVITTVSTLAIGMGLMTIAFTIFNAYVLRPFAIRDPHSLHQIVWHARDGGGTGFRWRDHEALSRRTDLFRAVIGEHTRHVSSNGRLVLAAIVSSNYLDALGPAMQFGRGFGSDDTAAAGNPVVLSDTGWPQLLNRDPSAVGRTIELNGRTFTVVGVLAPAFTGLGDLPRDVFLPLMAWRSAGASSDQLREIEITVRLQPDVAAAQAETALTSFMNEIIEKQQDVRAEVRPQPSPNTISPEVLVLFGPVFVAFGLVLVTSCANVSNMMLARALARHREMAVRLSIGASRGRIVRQLLTEGLVIALIASVVGLAIAAWGLRAGTSALFSTLPSSVTPLLRLNAMTFDARVFLFALIISGTTTLLFALLPALQVSRVPLVDALRGQGSAATGGSRLRNALVCAQVAVALVLVIVATTLARNSVAVGAMDVGFETTGVMSINVRGEQRHLARPLADRLGADARASGVAVTSGNPLFNAARRVAATPADGSVSSRTRLTFVSPEFFSILQIPIAQGRGFLPDEARAAAPVAIVSVATAGAFWPGEDPIGKTIRIDRRDATSASDDDLASYKEVTVVGTVRDIVTGFMLSGLDGGHIYLPVTTTDDRATAILVRGRTNRELGAEALRETIGQLVPDPLLFEIVPLADIRDLQVYPLLAASWVGSLLGTVALILSVSGLYGVLTYALSQRSKEIGIRMALGATARAVIGLVLKQSARLTVIGIVAGASVAYGVLKLLTSAIQLRNFSLLDSAAFIGGVVIVAAATQLAAYHPARRATRVDPSQALHTDG